MKLVLVGYGAMGRDLENLIHQRNDIEIVAIKGKEILPSLDLNDIKDFDVLVDFSHPNNLEQILQFLSERKKPGVLCTTGYNTQQYEDIKVAAQSIAILNSRNMSLGISILKKMVRKINQSLDYEFDIEIIETHHNKKLDAPSGTALMLAEELKKDQEYSLINRRHENRRREKNEIAIHAIRGGSVVGDHSVLFFGDGEYIEIKHSASSKRLYCLGALKAAEFIVNKKSGVFTMDDVIDNKM